MELEPDIALCVAMLKRLAMLVQATALSALECWAWGVERPTASVAVGRAAYFMELELRAMPCVWPL